MLLDRVLDSLSAPSLTMYMASGGVRHFQSSQNVPWLYDVLFAVVPARQSDSAPTKRETGLADQ